ncbi:MAG: hypothetical protein LC753_04180, partial [Acidobacteria bacterium]|nr:hypothetical protein [Acidobacteriota bacterium]
FKPDLTGVTLDVSIAPYRPLGQPNEFSLVVAVDGFMYAGLGSPLTGGPAGKIVMIAPDGSTRDECIGNFTFAGAMTRERTL